VILEAVVVISDDVARRVDAVRKGAKGGQGIVEGRVGAIAIEKAVGATVNPDDLARRVDALCNGRADT
jgi:threonine aldolase